MRLGTASVLAISVFAISTLGTASSAFAGQNVELESIDDLYIHLHRDLDAYSQDSQLAVVGRSLIDQFFLGSALAPQGVRKLQLADAESVRTLLVALENLAAGQPVDPMTLAFHRYLSHLLRETEAAR